MLLSGSLGHKSNVLASPPSLSENSSNEFDCSSCQSSSILKASSHLMSPFEKINTVSIATQTLMQRMGPDPSTFASPLIQC